MQRICELKNGLELWYQPLHNWYWILIPERCAGEYSATPLGGVDAAAAFLNRYYA